MMELKKDEDNNTLRDLVLLKKPTPRNINLIYVADKEYIHSRSPQTIKQNIVFYNEQETGP